MIGDGRSRRVTALEERQGFRGAPRLRRGATNAGEYEGPSRGPSHQWAGHIGAARAGLRSATVWPGRFRALGGVAAHIGAARAGSRTPTAWPGRFRTLGGVGATAGTLAP